MLFTKSLLGYVKTIEPLADGFFKVKQNNKACNKITVLNDKSFNWEESKLNIFKNLTGWFIILLSDLMIGLLLKY